MSSSSARAAARVSDRRAAHAVAVVRPLIGRPQRRPVGYLMEPRAERVPNPQPTRLFDQYQKGCLERIFRIARIDQHTAADTQNHRSVPFDQDRER